MNQDHEVITKFYQAFQRLDWKTMQACYHPEASFSDPVFQNLTNVEVNAMWHMLCENATDFSLHYSEVTTNGNDGSCRWDAWYSFSHTGRKIHNIIHADFKFRDGLIIHHVDKFNFWKWSVMALGLSGYFLGWTPIIKDKVRATAHKSLMKFMKEHPQYAHGGSPSINF